MDDYITLIIYGNLGNFLDDKIRTQAFRLISETAKMFLYQIKSLTMYLIGSKTTLIKCPKPNKESILFDKFFGLFFSESLTKIAHCIFIHFHT